MAEDCAEFTGAIVRQFFAMIPWRNMQWGDRKEMTKLTVAEQKDIISRIFRAPIVERFPPSKLYQRKFLKNFMQMLEQYEVEVLEDLYVIYSDMVQEKDVQEEFCYRSYYIGDHETITLKESVSLLSQGTTGLRTWEASLHLTEWMMEDPSFFKSKRVIELGSGLGLVGISVLRALEPECFLFTDCNLSVLDILQKNIELNANEKAFKCLQYSVEQLDWQHCKENHIFQQDYDIVLAADVVFDTSLVPSLVSVLSRLLSKQRDAVAVLSTTVRNEGTYVYFKQVLGGEGLNACVLPTPVCISTLYYDRHAKYEILKISV